MNSIGNWLRGPRGARQNPPVENELGFDPSIILSPARPNLERARTLLRRFPKTQSGMKTSWEAAAVEGLIPEDWVGAEEREFMVSGGAYANRHPPTPRSFLVVASDAKAMQRAEHLLIAHEEAMRPWHVRQGRPTNAKKAWWLGKYFPANEVWSGVDPNPSQEAAIALGAGQEGAPMQRAMEAARETVLRLVGNLPGLATVPLRGLRAEMVSMLRHELTAELLWRRAAAAGLRVPMDGDCPIPLRGQLFSDLQSPYAPLVSLWSLGYARGPYASNVYSLFAPSWNFVV